MTALRVHKRGGVTVAALLLATGLAGLGVVAWMHREPALPYQDAFASSRAAEWTPIGGAWQINDGAVFNRSDERGAKLVTGSSQWSNYQLSADLELIGHEGDVGLMVRLSDEERGIDSYNGYYVGLRSADSALVIGRADHGWVEGRPVAMEGGVQIAMWYRLRVVVVGCNIGAQATNLTTGQTSWAAFTEQPCVSRGRIGLRSMSTGGAWRNISVTPASEAEWQTIRSHAAFLQTPIYPIREADYNHMRQSYFKETYLPARSYKVAGGSESTGPVASAPLVSIETVRTTPSREEAVMIRGVVTLTTPLYVQDQTGSLAVQLSGPVALNLGDEVEVTGRPLVSGVTPRFAASSVRMLWDRTPVAPVSITSTKAAGGAFDASLVEVRGVLGSKQMGADGIITLQLADEAQSFRVVAHGGLSPAAFDSWQPGSQLRIRGVCTVAPAFQQGGSAFTVLLRTIDDVEVLSEPPWWTGKRMARLVILLLVLIALGVYLYLRIERWKMRAILDERERLAHEMHDTLAQSFAGVGFHLQGVRNSMRSGKSDTQTVIEKLDIACDLVAHTHREASAGIAALHPDEFRDLLLALERCTRSMVEGNELPFTFVSEGTARPLSMPVHDMLFQVGREAITNVLRHSRATEMTVKLIYGPKSVELSVRDNGGGFDYDPAANDFGIRTMQRRCRKVSATLSIVSSAGQGTLLTVVAPYGLRLTLADWLRSLRSRSSHA